MTIEQYLRDPCRNLSIPYWKHTRISLPKNWKIVHDSDYVESLYSDYTDTRYFRLIHDFHDLRPVPSERFEIRTADPSDIPLFADLINRSYPDLTVTEEQVRSFSEHPTYDHDLWILVSDPSANMIIGCGIAEFDREIGEGALEWIQVLPSYRKQGVGSLIVRELLLRLKKKAQFVTVSGKLDSASHPESLYRKCGFRGTDIWHILQHRC